MEPRILRERPDQAPGLAGPVADEPAPLTTALRPPPRDRIGPGGGCAQEGPEGGRDVDCHAESLAAGPRSSRPRRPPPRRPSTSRRSSPRRRRSRPSPCWTARARSPTWPRPSPQVWRQGRGPEGEGDRPDRDDDPGGAIRERQGDVSIISDVPAAVASSSPTSSVSPGCPRISPPISAPMRDPLIVVSSATCSPTTPSSTQAARSPTSGSSRSRSGRGGSPCRIRSASRHTPTGSTRCGPTMTRQSVRRTEHFGKPLKTDKGSAAEAWVAAIAANAPLLTDADAAAGQAVAAPGQTEPFIGIVSTAKFRDNEAAATRSASARGRPVQRIPEFPASASSPPARAAPTQHDCSSTMR